MRAHVMSVHCSLDRSNSLLRSPALSQQRTVAGAGGAGCGVQGCRGRPPLAATSEPVQVLGRVLHLRLQTCATQEHHLGTSHSQSR